MTFQIRRHNFGCKKLTILRQAIHCGILNDYFFDLKLETKYFLDLPLIFENGMSNTHLLNSKKWLNPNDKIYFSVQEMDLLVFQMTFWQHFEIEGVQNLNNASVIVHVSQIKNVFFIIDCKSAKVYSRVFTFQGAQNLTSAEMSFKMRRKSLSN